MERISLPGEIFIGNTTISQTKEVDSKGNVKRVGIPETELKGVSIILDDVQSSSKLLRNGGGIQYRLGIKSEVNMRGEVEGKKWLQDYASKPTHRVKASDLFKRAIIDPKEVAKSEISSIISKDMTDAQKVAALKEAGLL